MNSLSYSATILFRSGDLICDHSMYAWHYLKVEGDSIVLYCISSLNNIGSRGGVLYCILYYLKIEDL